MASKGLIEVLRALRVDVAAELEPLLEALEATDPDDAQVDEAWQRILEEAIREA